MGAATVTAYIVPSIGPIYPHFVDLCRILAQVFDVA